MHWPKGGGVVVRRISGRGSDDGSILERAAALQFGPLVNWRVAGALCATCGGLIGKGMRCEACAGLAATLAASGAPTAPGLAGVTADRKKTDPLIGAEVIGQYVIRSLLGKGGMGAVYLADQQSVGRRAVIKVLHPVHSRDPDSQSRFETEARAASQLSHPNIVTIYNYGAMADGTLFLAMEHLDGQTLEQASAKRRLPLPRVVNVVAQIAEALGEAHRHGVVHRDVKPSNVMLVARGQAEDIVKVLDFGIAHVDGKRITATGAVCGTPTYMSPEQIRSQPIDGRSDLYSLGCMLFELVTGQVPFSGGNTLGLAYKHVHEPPPRASDVAPKANVSSALDAFLSRALAKDRDDRPRNADAFRDELRAATSAPAATTPVPEAIARVETKPTVKAKVRAASKPAVRLQRETGAFRRGVARITSAALSTGSFFRRRKSLGQRVIERMRGFGRRRPAKRWAWIVVVSVIGLSVVGVGWVLLRRMDRDDQLAVPAKPPAPARTPSKPARTKRQVSGSKLGR